MRSRTGWLDAVVEVELPRPPAHWLRRVDPPGVRLGCVFTNVRFSSQRNQLVVWPGLTWLDCSGGSDGPQLSSFSWGRRQRIPLV